MEFVDTGMPTFKLTGDLSNPNKLLTKNDAAAMEAARIKRLRKNERRVILRNRMQNTKR